MPEATAPPAARKSTAYGALDSGGGVAVPKEGWLPEAKGLNLPVYAKRKIWGKFVGRGGGDVLSGGGTEAGG